ncbi:transcriptional regulator PpsR [Rhodopseudomonas palustris]|uniref:Putative PAS/PAC sensor protein n=1 Tax=Rhodopseudomonas palustris (strain BisB18) TaxID=316056 RepID=Q219R6_RHOPB
MTESGKAVAEIATRPTGQPDLTLLLDMDGIIRDATLSGAMAGESIDGWLGRPWSEVAGETGGDKIKRMVDDARAIGFSAFRQINQRFPSGVEIPMEFTTMLLGDQAGMLVLGKNLQAVAELHARLIAAQQTMERDYWRLREVETRYRLVFEASNEAVVIVSPTDLRIVEANLAAVQALTGLQRGNEDLAGREFLLDIRPQDREAARAMLSRVRERGKALSILVHLGPSAQPWMLRGALMPSEPGQIFLLHFTPAAVSAPSPEQIEHSAIKELIDRVPDGFVALDAAGGVQHANQAFLDLVQVGTKAAVIGESLARWLSQPGADWNALLSQLRRYKTVRLFRTTLRGELGSETEVEISAVDVDGDEQSYVGVLLRNVSRRFNDAVEGDSLRMALGPISEQLGRSSLRKLVKDTVSIVEQHYVKEALEHAGGNRTATAELLGLSRQSLYAKLNRYGLDDREADTQDISED